jgi:activating signal cointegrator 1
VRAVSVHQPWATAVALRAKRIETRHWSTQYRGELLIHAAKRCNKTELRAYAADPAWIDALQPAGAAMAGKPLWELLPLGQVVAVCNLADCRPVESFSWDELDELRRHDETQRCGWTEGMMGNFGPGRFGWVLEDIQAFKHPVPFKGGQSFFDVPRSLVACELASWPGANWRPQL